jgi:hypothetical protein
MRECYEQILSTYFTRTRVWPLLLILLFVGMMAPLWNHNPQEFWAGGIFVMWYFMAITLHLREQISRPEATVIPQYRVLHLTVAALLMLPVLLLTAFIASIGYRVSFLPIMSAAFAFCSILAWTMYRPSIVSVIVTTALWGVPFSETGGHVAAYVLTGAPVLVVVAFLIGGTVVFVRVARHLMSLTEESPEYAIGASFARDVLIPSGTANALPKTNYASRWQYVLSGSSDRALERVIASPNRTLLQRLARLRAPSRTRGAIPLLVLAGIGWLVLCFYSDDHGKSNPFLSVFLWTLPASITLLSACQLGPTLAYEFIRPISRQRFLQERLLLLCFQFGEVWLVFAGTLVCSVFLFTPSLLWNPAGWLYLVASLVIQWAAFTFALWLLHFRRDSLIGIPVCFLPFFAIFLGVGLPNRYTGLADISSLLLFIIIALLVGAFFLHNSYRRWLMTDLA